MASSGATGACRLCLAALWLCTCSQTARAQQPIGDILSFLVTNQSIPTGDFEKDTEAAGATRDTISRALLVALATLPVSSSSGGFSYRFNSRLGTVERASESFGPFFIERALPAGDDQASFGVSYQYAHFGSLDGHPLRTGQFVTTANKFRDEAQPFDVEALSLRIETNTVTAFGNYGVTDRLDVGVAVPFVALRLAGERTNTYRGRSLLQATASAFKTGLADVAVRAKYNLFASRGTGLAAGTELRLPTGRKEDLLGSGTAALKLLAIGSVEGGRLTAHFNAGYGTGGISDEVSYAGALAVAAGSRVTVSVEAFGRRLEGLRGITQVVVPHPVLAGVDTIRLLPQGPVARTALAVAGFKWNFAGTWLLSGNLLLPLTDAGLKARPTPTVALDYSFER